MPFLIASLILAGLAMIAAAINNQSIRDTVMAFTSGKVHHRGIDSAGHY